MLLEKECSFDSLAKENIQQDMNKLLLQVQKELKKKMFPKKHVKLLYNNVNISIENMGNNILGSYKTIDNSEHKHKFTHKIVINANLYYEYKFGLLGLNIYKRVTKKKIKNVIAHELIHAYVYENYEVGSDLYGFHNDGSPIFLAILTFLNIPSGHNSMLSFNYSFLYNKIKEFETFYQLEKYLIHLTINYEKALSNVYVVKKDEKIFINNFIFSSGIETGLIGYSTITTSFKSGIIKNNLFIIGANIPFDKLEESLIRKSENNLFIHKIHSLQFIEKENLKTQLKIQTLNV